MKLVRESLMWQLLALLFSRLDELVRASFLARWTGAVWRWLGRQYRCSLLGILLGCSSRLNEKLPESLFGRGEFFLLRARGDSMIGAGIEDGDLVLIRQQSTAEYNQIVVALVDDEATLKRFRPKEDHICLHPENNRYEDIIVDRCLIQGVAVKVIKDLN